MGRVKIKPVCLPHGDTHSKLFLIFFSFNLSFLPMGRKSRHKRSRVLSSQLLSQQMDLPLANFSENPSKTFREQKRNSKALKDLGQPSNNEVEDEADGDDTPEDWEEREEDTDDEIVSISQVEVFKPKAQYREEDCIQIQDDSDFWYLLSKYIQPSDVGKFALICKASYYTVATLGFWRKLYLRHFDPVIHYDLPE